MNADCDDMGTARSGGYVLTDRDLYYLRSIQRQLEASATAGHLMRPSLGSVIAADNIDWLDCLIDTIDRNAEAASVLG